MSTLRAKAGAHVERGNEAAATLALPAPRGASAGPRFLQRSPIGRLLLTFRKEFIWVVIFSAFVNLLMLSPTIYMLQVFDRVFFSHNLVTLTALTVLLVFFLAVMAFAEWVRSMLLVRAGSRFDEALNRRVFSAAFKAQLSARHGNPTQPLLDLNALRQFLTGNGVFAMVDTPWTLVFIAALFLMHPWLGWLAVFFVIVQLVLGFTSHRYAMRSRKTLQNLSLDAQQYLQAKFRNAETVHAMGMQGNLRRQWQALNDLQAEQHSRSHEAQHRIQAVMKWLQYTQQALMLSMGAVLVIRGQMGVGAMVASNALMGNALRPVGLIVQVWSQFADARAAFDRLNVLFETHPEADLATPVDTVLGQVTLRGLTATAPGREEPILRGLDATFKAGEVIGIVGPSGAGKSTLARCLLGVWPDASGEVLIDGREINDWPREVLGPQLGYLPQDVELFDGTIAGNIARFADLPSNAVIEAAMAAGIHDMVLRQPGGYDTPIGDGGSSLSGGQRQRIGLARAILNHPQIVVLDEPSANLDDVGETSLMRAVAALKARGSTVFMIVHQQHLLAVVDRVLVLEEGRITKLLPMSKSSSLAPAAAARGPAAPALNTNA
ncbi:MAG: type I secretion system permease/ATPase [Pseudomonadota bacterium]|nr:type I secretion system permease/ATPase [Pseudomonadota bacterium]